MNKREFLKLMSAGAGLSLLPVVNKRPVTDIVGAHDGIPIIDAPTSIVTASQMPQRGTFSLKNEQGQTVVFNAIVTGWTMAIHRDVIDVTEDYPNVMGGAKRYSPDMGMMKASGTIDYVATGEVVVS